MFSGWRGKRQIDQQNPKFYGAGIFSTDEWMEVKSNVEIIRGANKAQMRRINMRARMNVNLLILYDKRC